MGRTREKILEISNELFTEQGYVNTSLAQIAKQVGIQKASIFSHFNSKNEIFMEVLDQKIKEYKMYTEAIFNKYKEEDLEVLYEKYVESIITYLNEGSTKFWFQIIIFPNGSIKDLVASKMTPLSKIVEEHLVYILQKGIQCGLIKEKNLNKLLKYFWNFIYGNLSLYLYDDTMTYSDFKYIYDLFWKSMTK